MIDNLTKLVKSRAYSYYEESDGMEGTGNDFCNMQGRKSYLGCNQMGKIETEESLDKV